MDLTSEAAATQNQNQNKSIQGCEDEGGNEKKGDFLMLVTEILNALIRNDFDAAEIKIILFIAKKTIGQKCKFRSFSVGSIATETQIVERHVKRVLQKLVQKTALIKVKRKGERHPQYGLSIEYFGRTNVGQIENVYYLDKEFENTKVTLRALSKGHQSHFQKDQKTPETGSCSASQELSTKSLICFIKCLLISLSIDDKLFELCQSEHKREMDKFSRGNCDTKRRG